MSFPKAQIFIETMKNRAFYKVIHTETKQKR